MKGTSITAFGALDNSSDRNVFRNLSVFVFCATSFTHMNYFKLEINGSLLLTHQETPTRSKTMAAFILTF